jgi:hypothetical protein
VCVCVCACGTAPLPPQCLTPSHAPAASSGSAQWNTGRSTGSGGRERAGQHHVLLPGAGVRMLAGRCVRNGGEGNGMDRRKYRYPVCYSTLQYPLEAPTSRRRIVCVWALQELSFQSVSFISIKSHFRREQKSEKFCQILPLALTGRLAACEPGRAKRARRCLCLTRLLTRLHARHGTARDAPHARYGTVRHGTAPCAS